MNIIFVIFKKNETQFLNGFVREQNQNWKKKVFDASWIDIYIYILRVDGYIRESLRTEWI